MFSWPSFFWALGAAALTGIGQAAASGLIPVPTDWTWFIPVAVFVISAATPQIWKRVNPPPGG